MCKATLPGAVVGLGVAHLGPTGGTSGAQTSLWCLGWDGRVCPSGFVLGETKQVTLQQKPCPVIWVA